VADEAAEDSVVVERPVHNPKVGVLLASAEDALVVVGEPDHIHSVVLVVVGVKLSREYEDERDTYYPFSRS